MKNLEGHQVDGHGVFTSGADVGFVATLIATIAAMAIAAFAVADVDIWTFWKGVATLLLGEGAVSPPTGFEVGPVLVGAGIHLFVGALVGGLYALAIAYLDLEEMTPIILVTACIFGILTFMLIWVPLSVTLVPGLDAVPALFAGWMIVAFSVLLAVGVTRWRQKWDCTECPHSNRERSGWLYTAHREALAASIGTLVLVIVGLTLANHGDIRWAIAAPVLLLQAVFALVVLQHARRDHAVIASASSS